MNLEELPVGVNPEDAIQGVDENIEAFIIKVSRSAGSISVATAGTIAADFDGDFASFLGASEVRFGQIKTSRGRQLLKDSQIESLLSTISKIPNTLPIEETWVFFLGRKFLEAQVKMVETLSLESFDINPLLSKALGLDSPRKVIAFNVYQTVTRSVVTSWGSTVEDIAKYVGCKDNDYTIEGQTGTNFDLIKNLDGVDYYIQVKSGPNTMNVGMVTSLNAAIERIEATKPNVIGMLGMTYGTRGRISAQITSNLRDADQKMKIGREFWDFISEREDFHKRLFELLDSSAEGILADSFIELVEAKITSLERIWLARNEGRDLNEMLENYI